MECVRVAAAYDLVTWLCRSRIVCFMRLVKETDTSSLFVRSNLALLEPVVVLGVRNVGAIRFI